MREARPCRARAMAARSRKEASITAGSLSDNPCRQPGRAPPTRPSSAERWRRNSSKGDPGAPERDIDPGTADKKHTTKRKRRVTRLIIGLEDSGGRFAQSVLGWDGQQEQERETDLS